jgi:hypothetical protein
MFIPLLIIFGTFVTDTVARKNGRPNRKVFSSRAADGELSAGAASPTGALSAAFGRK